MFFNRKKIIVSLIILCLAGGGWSWWKSRPAKALWTTETVSRGDVLETVSVVGKLRPVEYADISFPMLGTIEKIFFNQGDAIRKGDIIATLDTSVLQSQLKQSQVALSIAEENEKLAHRDWEDLKPEERAVKKLSTKQARESVRFVAAEIDQSRIVAPLDGALSKLDARVGETVIAGRIIGRVSGPGNFIIEADVPEADIAKVAPGKSAEVTFDSLSSDEKFEATVESIDPAANVIQDVIYYTVKFTLRTPDDRLKEGMSANIDIRISERKQVLIIPYRAIERDGENSFVEVATGPAASDRRRVDIGIEGDDGSVEVLSGVQEGDQVIVSKNK